MTEAYHEEPVQSENPPEPQPVRLLPADFPQNPPRVTYTILALTVLVYLGQIASQYLLAGDLPASFGMKVNRLIESGQLWRLFTPMLLHGGLLHIGFNMYALYAIGPFLEQTFGSWRFFLLYVVSGFAGNVMSFLLTDANSLGASTAIFGIFAAQGIFIYQNRQIFGSRSRVMLNRIISLAVINLIIGMQAGIDNWGHIGGLLSGIAFTWFAGPVFNMEVNPPRVRLIDSRNDGQGFLAALGIGLIFGLITLAAISLR